MTVPGVVEAPVRHVDHVRAHAAGGPTALANGAGLCESCHHLKQAPGWRTEVIDRRGQVIAFTTPTGDRYRSQAPPTPGHHPHTLDEHVERIIDDWDDGWGDAVGGEGASA
jgi:hypothetical protein